jgi:hypothetical protein
MTYDVILFIVGLIAFAGIVGMWRSTALRSSRLMDEMKHRMPGELVKICPEAFEPGRHPRKLFFVLSKECATLTTQDGELEKRVKTPIE